jgi:hypothetical protein
MEQHSPFSNSTPHGAGDHAPFHICPGCECDLATGTDCTGLPALCTACKALASIRQAHLNYAAQFAPPITHRFVVYLAYAAEWIERKLQAVQR